MENKFTPKDSSVPADKERSWNNPLYLIPAWLRNKYFLCGFGFIIWMLFFDPRDIFSQLSYNRELKELKESKSHYQKEIAKEAAELEALKSNPAIVEKYAREKYLMKRENEDLFIVSENSEKPNN